MNTGTKRRSYDEAFKRETVRRLIESKDSISAFAVSIGVDRTNLQKWKKNYGFEFLQPFERTNKGVAGSDEFSSLKKDLESLKETVDKLRCVVKKIYEIKYVDKD